MNTPTRKQSAGELRRAFDASFAAPPALGNEAGESLIAIRAQTTPLAIRVSEIGGVQRCPPLTAVPSRNPALCGLAGVRGAVVAVYSIAALTGDRAGAAGCAWIVLCKADRSAALGFDHLIGYERVAPGEACPVALAGGPHLAGLAQAVVRVGDEPCAVVPVSSLLNHIQRLAGASPIEESPP